MRLTESDILFLKKYAGLLTEEEEKLYNTLQQNLTEGIQFSFPINRDTNKDFLVKNAYSLCYQLEDAAKKVSGGKEFLDKVKDVGPTFVEDWSSPMRREDGSSTAINFYLNYKADKSDEIVIKKILHAIKARAKELDFKLGEFDFITSQSEDGFYHERGFDVRWPGKTRKKSDQDMSTVRVINIPIVKFPESDEILDFSIDMHHQAAGILFNIMRIPHDKGVNPLSGGETVMEHGVLKNKDIPIYLRNLLKAKNSDLSKYTVDTHSSGGEVKRRVDRSSNVTSINPQRSARRINFGISEDRIRQHIDELIKMLQKAQKYRLDVQWA